MEDFSGRKRGREWEEEEKKIIACFFRREDIPAALEDLSALVSDWTKEEREERLLAPTLLSRFSISLYWTIHLKNILSFSAFLRRVNMLDIVSMLKELESSAPDGLHSDLLRGCLLHIFRDVDLSTLQDDSPSFCVDHSQKCLKILLEVCLPSFECHMGKDSTLEKCFSQSSISSDMMFFIHDSDLTRIKIVSSILSVSHGKEKIEAWKALVLRLLLFCRILFDETLVRDKINHDDHDVHSVKTCLMMFDRNILTRTISFALRAQKQCVTGHSWLTPLPHSSACLLHLNEYFSPFDRDETNNDEIPNECFSVPILDLILSPIFLDPPCLPHDDALEHASSVGQVGITEEHSQFLLRSFYFIVAAEKSKFVHEPNLIAQWLDNLIQRNNSPLKAKEIRFICLTLCSVVNKHCKFVLQTLCSVFRKPDVRSLDPGHDSVDTILQICRSRLRELEQVMLNLEGRGNKVGRGSILEALSRSAAGSKMKLSEVTSARVRSWAATFSRTGELPVSVAQLCHFLCQSRAVASHSLPSRNIVLATKSYQDLFDCMETLLREQALCQTTHAASSSSDTDDLSSFVKSCQMVAEGMVKATPPLCSQQDATQFVHRLNSLSPSHKSPSGGPRAGVELEHIHHAELKYILNTTSSCPPLEKSLSIPASLCRLVSSVTIPSQPPTNGTTISAFDIDHTAEEFHWISKKFQDELKSQWAEACRQSVAYCASHNDGMTFRFTAVLSLLVLKASHAIYCKLTELHNLAKRLLSHRKDDGLAGRISFIVRGLFRLSQLLLSTCGRNNSSMSHCIVQLIRHSWAAKVKQKPNSCVDVNQDLWVDEVCSDMSETGTNALVLLSVPNEVSPPSDTPALVWISLVHLWLCHQQTFLQLAQGVMTAATNCDLSTGLMLLCLRKLAQLQCIRNDCFHFSDSVEADIFMQNPIHTVMFLILHSSSNTSLKSHDKLAGELNRRVLNQLLLEDDNCITNIFSDSVPRIIDFLGSESNRSVFVWSYKCSTLQSMLSRFERIDFTSHLWLFMFLKLQSTETETCQQLFSDKRDCSFGHCLVEALLHCVEGYCSPYSALGKDNFQQDSVNGEILNFIEFIIETLNVSLSRLSAGITLIQLCHNFIGDVWDRMSGFLKGSDKQTASRSPASVTEEISSTNFHSSSPKLEISFAQQIEVSCALTLLRISNGPDQCFKDRKLYISVFQNALDRHKVQTYN